MPRTITPEMTEAAEAAKVANQSKARGKATTSKATVTPEAPKRQPAPEGQQRSRGRLILSAKQNKAGEVAGCNFGTSGCGNPARWPVGQNPELREHPEVKATTVTCTTHLRTVLRGRNMLERQAEFETVMCGGTVKAQPKRRRTRKSKATQTNA